MKICFLFLRKLEIFTPKIKAEDKKVGAGGSGQANLPEVISYLPYKCGLCDHASETLEAIREHSRTGHEINCQFKCSLCDVSSDNKAEVEKHCQDKHGSTSVMMRIYYVDPTSISNLDQNDLKSKFKMLKGIFYMKDQRYYCDLR